MTDRRERGLGGDSLGHAHRRVTRRATCPVRHRDERWPQLFELANRLEQRALALLGFRGEELEGERVAALRKELFDRAGALTQHGRATQRHAFRVLAGR